MNLDRDDPLAAVSPLDGRYASHTAALSPHVSEAGLIRARVRVECEYLLALAAFEPVDLALDAEERAAVAAVADEFDGDDARLVKRIETEGAAGYAATNHDVKAVEYFLRVRLEERLGGAAERLTPWIHFGLTSEDVTNLAYRLTVAAAVEDVLLPALETVRDELTALARAGRDVPMLARTHGQPATPTTFGKEMAVYASRVGRSLGRIRRAREGLAGKLAGASGTYAAHEVAYPDADWPAFARSFVADLGLEHVPLTTQINPGDDFAALFDALRGTNAVLLDLAQDAWLYVAEGYLGQPADDDETGSSTMPHKVNPIDFENAEGNLKRATSDLGFLGESLTTSRLQRDLSDSTVKRTIGAALARCLLAYRKLVAGLDAVVPDERAMREDLESTPEVIGEAVQTILRREGDAGAYERVKALTRGREVDLAAFRDLFDDLAVDDAVGEELAALRPEEYVGLAPEMVDDLADGETPRDGE